MATEDESDVECKAIKANSGLGLSAAGCSSAVSVHVCGHTPCLRLQGDSFWRRGGVRELFDCFVYTIRPLLELWEHSKAIVSNDCASSDSLMNRLYYTLLYFFISFIVSVLFVVYCYRYRLLCIYVSVPVRWFCVFCMPGFIMWQLSVFLVYFREIFSNY